MKAILLDGSPGEIAGFVLLLQSRQGHRNPEITIDGKTFAKVASDILLGETTPREEK